MTEQAIATCEDCRFTGMSVRLCPMHAAAPGQAEHILFLKECLLRAELHEGELGQERDRLREALKNAQEIIHLQFCKRGDQAGNKNCWKECREALAVLAEGGAS